MDTTLVFESRFESGNLYQAIRRSKFEYELLLQPDTNSRGHTQWFYFQVSNTLPNVRYKFVIKNLYKKDKRICNQ